MRNALVLTLATGLTISAQAAPLPKNIALLPPLRLEHSRVSPDGRWLVGSQMKIIEIAYFYDFKLKKSFAFAPLNFKNDETNYAVNSYFWRDDSRVCAVSNKFGWEQVTPVSQNMRPMPHFEPADCADWSSQGKLAVFAEGSGNYRIWDGRRGSKHIKWTKKTGFPYPDDLQAWDSEWSPNGQRMMLRFYGHSARDSNNAGHLGIFDAKTLRWLWSNETNQARWVDNTRLMFEDDDDGYDKIVGISTLKIGQKGTQPWLKDVVGWTLTRDRKTVWAVTKTGDLMRSPTSRKAWQTVRRGLFSAKTVPQDRLPLMTLTLSPRQDMLALSYRYASSNLMLFSTSAKKPWTLNWKPTSGQVQLVGWQSGKSLPLVEWYGQKEGEARVGQILR